MIFFKRITALTLLTITCLASEVITPRRSPSCFQLLISPISNRHFPNPQKIVIANISLYRDNVDKGGHGKVTENNPALKQNVIEKLDAALEIASNPDARVEDLIVALKEADAADNMLILKPHARHDGPTVEEHD